MLSWRCRDTMLAFLVLQPVNRQHPYSRIMAQGVYSATNRNEYQKIYVGKAWPACKADNLSAIYEPTV
jgi:hypothetical protein